MFVWFYIFIFLNLLDCLVFSLKFGCNWIVFMWSWKLIEVKLFINSFVLVIMYDFEGIVRLVISLDFVRELCIVVLLLYEV